MDITNRREVPRPEGQSSQGQANFSDSSGPLFHMYIKMTEGEDEKMTHRWQKDADGILIFTGLFSAALAALLTVSLQDLKPNSQDTSAFYLANIYQLLADPNISRASILATPAQPPHFSPQSSAVLVNSLWFLSLVISLTSALLATMLQQWARRFLTITQPPRYSPHRRASIRAFFANGVEKFHLPWSVEALPALLHLSLFLFFTGLVIYLFNINHTVFSAVVWWVGLAGGVYGCITFMPIFWHDSPYYSPLSSSAWLFFNFTFSAIRYLRSQGRYLEGYVRFEGLTKIVQDAGSKLSAEINNSILTWTLHSLEEDKELEQFFEAIPGFCSSTAVRARHLQLAFNKFDKPLADAFSGFIYRTLLFSLFLEEDKKRRVIICAKATDAARLTDSIISILRSVFLYGDYLLRSVDIWQSLRSTRGDQVPGLCSQGIIAGVVASVSERDERWKALAKDQLGLSEEVFRNYLANGDSLLLANFIHITRPLFRLGLEDKYMAFKLMTILSRLSNFDIENTLPGLQHDFCALWNEITQEAHNRGPGSYYIPVYILGPIRRLYIALHQGTDAAPTAFDASTPGYSAVLDDPFSYLLCNIPGHHRLISTTGEASHPLTNTSDPPDAFLNPSTEPRMSFFPASTKDDSSVHFVGESSLHDVLDATPTIESSHWHRSPPVNVETSHPGAATTSLDLITQGHPDKAPIISSASNTDLDPHPAPAVSISTSHPSIPHPSISPPSTSNNIPYPQTSAGLRVVPDLQLSSPSGTDTPLPLPSPFVTSVSLPPPQGTSFSPTDTAPNDGTSNNDYWPRAQTSANVEIPEQSRESAIFVPDIATDASRLQVSTDIDRPA